MVEIVRYLILHTFGAPSKERNSWNEQRTDLSLTRSKNQVAHQVAGMPHIKVHNAWLSHQYREWVPMDDYLSMNITTTENQTRELPLDVCGLASKPKEIHVTRAAMTCLHMDTKPHLLHLSEIAERFCLSLSKRSHQYIHQENEIMALKQEIEQAGFTTRLARSCFAYHRPHQHYFLLVKISGHHLGCKDDSVVVVDLFYRDFFASENQTEQYHRFLRQLPLFYIGTLQSLEALVYQATVYLRQSFTAMYRDFPPWRQASVILGYWNDVELLTANGFTPAHKELVGWVLHSFESNRKASQNAHFPLHDQGESTVSYLTDSSPDASSNNSC